MVDTKISGLPVLPGGIVDSDIVTAIRGGVNYRVDPANIPQRYGFDYVKGETTGSQTLVAGVAQRLLCDGATRLINDHPTGVGPYWDAVNDRFQNLLADKLYDCEVAFIATPTANNTELLIDAVDDVALTVIGGISELLNRSGVAQDVAFRFFLTPVNTNPIRLDLTTITNGATISNPVITVSRTQ